MHCPINMLELFKFRSNGSKFLAICLLAARLVAACDPMECMPISDDECPKADKGIHVRVEAIGSCQEGSSDRYFLDVQIIEEFLSAVDEPKLESGEVMRLDYGAFLNCNSTENADAKECKHECAPREFAYPFKKDLEYVLYADLLSVADSSSNSSTNSTTSVQDSGVVIQNICNKDAELKVSGADTCSPNIEEPSDFELRLRRCACKGERCFVGRVELIEGVAVVGAVIVAVVLFVCCVRCTGLKLGRARGI